MTAPTPGLERTATRGLSRRRKPIWANMLSYQSLIIREGHKKMTKQSEQARRLAELYVEQLSDWAKIKTKPLFGAVALYRNDHVFAMTWQGALYFKVDADSRAQYEAGGSQPLGYSSEGEHHALKSYWAVPSEILEDSDKFCEWAERAYKAALTSQRKA
ncbi:TfoX/Sxy family protein [Bosea sp. NPDC003192]|uniref:TfoX/Sxy family protein n=1 Tax=Bosea sp. NPDC003192 TaxID=3390551 RepID=UPI003D01EA92